MAIRVPALRPSFLNFPHRALNSAICNSCTRLGIFSKIVPNFYVSVGIRTKVLCYVDHFQKCGSATQPKEREHYLYTTKIAYNFLIMN